MITKYYFNKLEMRDPSFQRRNNSLGGEGNRSVKNSTTLNNDLFDPDSGQPFFKPKVGRGPKNQSRPSPGP